MPRTTTRIKLSLGVCVVCLCAASGLGSELAPARLRCEYLENPIGIDVPRPRLSWIVESSLRDQVQQAWQIQAADTEANLRAGRANLWDSGRGESDETAQIEYAGKPLTAGEICFWRVRVWDGAGRVSRWSKPARWSMGPMKPADWHAKWIGMPDPNADPWLRRTFSLEARPARATVTVAALGLFELHVNGRKVGDDVLSPAVSDYSKRAMYLTFDVTRELRAGPNCVAIWLADRGWYAKGKPIATKAPVVLVQMEAKLPDGHTVRLGSDETWKAHESNIKGARYDATRELKDWDAPGLDDRDWTAASVAKPTTPLLKAQMVEPNRISEAWHAMSVKETGPGEYLIDMGRHFTGWFELRLRARRGTVVKFDYIEQLDVEGKPVTYDQRDEYVARGGCSETFRTRFNYHAFRWVKVSGLAERPRRRDAKGYLIHTGYANAGDFGCSNDLLNRIHDAVVWTYRCVSLGDYVVDCPHRERLGYGGDGQVTMENGLWHFGVAALYDKWLRDWQDAQDPRTGAMPNVAPAPAGSPGGGPTWGAICVTLPWALYVHYGDRRVLLENYSTMQRYMAYLASRSQNHVLRPPEPEREYDFLGDWVAPGRDMEKGPWSERPWRIFFVNGYHVYLLQMMEQIARLTDHAEDAAAYRQQAEAVRTAVNREFFDAARNSYVNGEQPYLALALLTGLVPDEHREAVMKNLEREIMITQKGHLQAGMHGVWFMFKYLTAIGRDDLIFNMVNQRTYPSWGYMLDQGATTIWERWDGYFSRIHSTLLAVGSWFPEGVAGIQPDELAPGFKHFSVRPGIVGDLRWARASYDSIRGPIGVEWRAGRGKFRLNVTVPANTTATLYIPADAGAKLSESNRPAARARGVHRVRREGGRYVVDIGSGDYRFHTGFHRS